MAEKTSQTNSSSNNLPSVPAVAPTSDTPYIQPVIGKLGYDTKHPEIFGLGSSPDNGASFHVWASFGGIVLDKDNMDAIWINGVSDRVKSEVNSATAEIPAVKSAADEAVKKADSAIASSKVNSDAIVAQSEAISEAKAAMERATAEIQQTASNAASDAAKIRADVAQVQNEVDTAKAANSASIEALKSDIDTAKQDLANVHDSLTKAQLAVEQNQKLINDSVAKISNDIEQDRKDIASAQQANDDTAKQLDTYSKQAQDQGKTIKSIQDKQDSFTATLADVQGNVSQVSDNVDGLSASLKDTQGNVATVKAQADQLNATLTDHAKSIATLTASAKELSSTLEDADGRLNKVEQTAQSNSSTLSDVQGDLSQVKQQADGLVTTLKDAQGDIDQIKQTAKGTAEQLSNAQGDITALQKDVNGIKLTIADHDKNIHTLQADSKTLKDDMTDAKGNISSLQKTATSLDSEFKDHDGRLSKVEQTASTLTNELSDEQGHLNRVEQTAQGTQQTVANQQGQINTIKTDAAGIHETLTGQGNQIANINVTLNGLNSKYEGVSGDLGKLKSQAQWITVTSAVDLNNIKTPCHEFLKGTVTNAPNEVAWWYLTVEGSNSGRITQTVIADQSNNRYTRRWADGWSAWVKDATQTDVTALSNRITTNSAQITQNQQAIALKADQSTVDNLSGEVSQNKAQLKVQAGQISSKVSSEDFKTLDDKVGGAIAKIQKNSTAIDQNNKQISLKADQTEVDKVKGTASQNSSRLDVMAGEIKSKVDGTAVNNILDSKGYATMSYAQTLVKQTKDQWNITVTDLDAKIKSKDGINLLTGTADFTGSWFRRDDGSWIDDNWRDIHNNRVRKRSGSSWDGLGQTVHLEPGNYTFSMDMYLNLGTNDSLNIYAGDTQYNGTANIVQLIDGNHYDHNNPQDSWFRAVCHFKVTKAGNVAIRPELNQGSGTVHVGSYKLEKGLIATPWTPAPSDNASVTQISNLQISIDGLQSTVASKADKSQITQLSNLVQSKVSSSDFNDLKDKTLWKSTDSIDLNTAVSQQKIFVKGGSNLPPGNYWWYVRVEPGYASRIAQYAVSDRDNIHYSRQYDGKQWTAWSQGATESEITQLRDDINLRVKSGDLLSQINLTAHNTLIQSNKIYLDSSSTVFSGKAFIPSAAITSLDAGKITTGYIRVPMSDGNGNSVSIGNDGVNIVSNNQNTPLFSQNRGTAKVNVNAAGMSFGATTNGAYEQLGSLSVLLDNTDGSYGGMTNHNGIGYVVETQQQYGYPYGGDFFSLARSIKGPPSYYNGFLYEATGSGKHEIGSHFFDPIWIHPWGADNYMHATWVSWTAWDNNEKYPAIVQAGSNMGGICFPKSGEVTLFTASGKYFTPSQWKGTYTGYQHGGAGNAYHDPSQDA